MNNVDLGHRIKQRRTDLGLTQGDIAAEVGVAISTIQRYETGSIERVKLPVIEAIARALHVNPDWLVGKTPDMIDYDDGDLLASIPLNYIEACDGDVQRAYKLYRAVEKENLETSLPGNILPMPATYTVPLLGTIACGEPILAAENIEDNVEVPENIHADFALRCKGDSMINARIHDGDIVYIRQQPAVNNGEIAAVLIGDEATLKRVYVYEDHVVLQPENPAYEPLVYFGETMSTVRILGKAVGFTSIIP
ncbi:MAG: transcriptional repressor LexA [Clostridiales bacterium]|nr:transcriptional repressor LexA [Clostridiales bacterium]